MTKQEFVRTVCERDKLDPDAPFIGPDGETVDCGEHGVFTNEDYYELVVEGYAPRPVEPGLVH